MIKEDFLHYLWKFQKFTTTNLTSTSGQKIQILQVGQHNHNAGPDFYNAHVIIDNQFWAGTVEIHVKASDWYLHGHEKDTNYNNVVLHVVWEDDVVVYQNNRALPTLSLQSLVHKQTLTNYTALLHSKKQFFNCEKDINIVPQHIETNWLERLYITRLEHKAKAIQKELAKTTNNWEEVLYRNLLKAFGLKVNSEAFYSIASSIPFSVFRKESFNAFKTEALLMGQAGLLQETNDSYSDALLEAYLYLKHKYNLSDLGVTSPVFYRLRPPNFPTIRLSQVANLYAKSTTLFNTIKSEFNIGFFEKELNVTTSSYWNTHYSFGKESPYKIKKTTSSVIQTLLLNAIIPIQFAYAKSTGKNITDKLIGLVEQLNPEQNTITQKFKSKGLNLKSAFQTQAVLEAYNNNCIKNKCLQCVVGNYLIKQ